VSLHYYQDNDVTVHHGDCLAVLKTLPDNSIDAVITDPPYALNFMSKHWDTAAIVFDATLWWQCLRVLKPGGHLAAFGGTRTWHRLAVAIEDAGFEIRDNLAWLYGSGFPKSLDVSKAIDKASGAERETVGVRPIHYADTPSGYSSVSAGGGVRPGGMFSGSHGDTASGRDITAPATDAARQWQGWGTALKPSHEPVILARKPLQGTVSQCVLKYGTGALNIAACRVTTSQDGAGSSQRDNTSCTCLSPEDGQTIRTPSMLHPASSDAGREHRSAPLASAPEHDLSYQQSQDSPDDCLSSPCSDGARAQSAAMVDQASAPPLRDAREPQFRCATPSHIQTNQSKPCPNCTAPNVETPAGRFPPNVLLDGHAAAELDGQSGTLHKRGNNSPSATSESSWFSGTGTSEVVNYDDTGGASRFFPVFRYTPKAPGHERPTYTREGDTRASYAQKRCRKCGKQPVNVRLSSQCQCDEPDFAADPAMANTVSHPTVKPVELMRWLVRLITPPGGVVLDPFAGTGTTAEAAIHEHKKAIVIEREADYMPLIVGRLHKPMAIEFDFDEVTT
jgi:DNA modification methylase